MRLSTFVRRPVLSGVIAMVLMLLGLVALPTLPVAQYPELAPPTVSVTATYRGASAETVEQAVTLPLEQALNGTEGMRYLRSTSRGDGTSRITLTFDPGRDPDVAAVDVQNRVSRASPRLPAEVNQAGIVIDKARTQLLLTFGVFSPDGRYDELFLSNYLEVNVVDALRRVRGVGEVRIFGQRTWAMRVWVDPARLAQRGLTAEDLVRALREQNVQAAAGAVGASPAPAGQLFELPVQAKSRLSDPADFEEIVLGRGGDGALVKLADVARVELGAESYGTRLRFNGREAVGLGISQLPTANALEVREEVTRTLERLVRDFPPGMTYQPATDVTRAVSASITDVVTSLLQAVGLVILVIFLFLHRLRALLIVAVTLPVSLVGAFLFVRMFGFSINTLTLFGLTLATGILVDDAIVVIENVERLLRGKGRTPLQAAEEGLGQVAGAVLATSLVMFAVFLPVTLLPGTTGRIYGQFALTIVASITLSMICALTLSPALCALLLRPQAHKAAPFRAIDRALEGLRARYVRGLAVLIDHRLWVALAFAVALGATFLAYRLVPRAFIPAEDQGFLIVGVQGPEGVSLDYTADVLLQVEEVLAAQPEVDAMFVVAGFSVLGSGPNYGVAFVTLKPWTERRDADQSVPAVVARLRGPLGAITGARVLPLQPPAIRGVGNIGGFEFVLQDRTGTASLDQLAEVTSRLVGAANADPRLVSVFSGFTAASPLLDLQVDRDAALAMGVPLDSVFATLQILLASQYVNDFDFANRTYRVYVQAEPGARSAPHHIGELYVRTDQGQMVPLEALVQVRPRGTAQTIGRHNLYRAAEVNGSAAPGESTGTAMEAMEEVARATLPDGFAFEWTGASLEQVEAGGRAGLIFALAVLFVFLVLAAFYESFLVPLVIMLSVPVALLGALGFGALRGLPNDIFMQVGLVLLVALASKNAILIVEFAQKLRAGGRSAQDAILEAARLRLRPVLMTSFALIFGVTPLLFARGAGAAGQRSLGTTIFGGMLVSTLVNLVFIPVLYVLLEGLRRRRAHPAAQPT